MNREKAQRRFIFICLAPAVISGNDLYIYSDDQCLPHVLVPHGWNYK